MPRRRCAEGGASPRVAPSHSTGREQSSRHRVRLHTLERKSAETLRLNSIVIGVLLTLASRFAGSDTTPPVDRFENWSSGVAIIFTFVSFVFAFLT